MNIISKNNTVRNTSLRESPCIYATCTRTVEYTSFVEHQQQYQCMQSSSPAKPSCSSNLRRPSLHADSLMRFALFCLVKLPFFNASALACSFKCATNQYLGRADNRQCTSSSYKRILMRKTRWITRLISHIYIRMKSQYGFYKSHLLKAANVLHQ